MTLIFGKLAAFVFTNRLGKLSAAAAGVVALVVAFAWEQRNIGAQRAITKVDKATANAASLGRRAADKSRAGGVRRQLDPTTRDD